MMRLGSALKVSDIKNNKKIISDVVESVIGAIYLFKGYKGARNSS